MTRIKFRYQKNENLPTDIQYREAGTVTFTEDSINVCIANDRVVNFVSSENISKNYVPLVVFENAMTNKANLNDVYGKSVVYRKDETYSRSEIDAKILASGQFDSALYFKKNEILTLLNNKADASNVYSKYDTDSILATKLDRTNAYSKSEIETKLMNKANNSDVYTKDEMDYKLSLKASGTSTYSREETYSRDEIDLMLGNGVVGPNGTVELSNYYTKRDVDNFLTFKASTTSTYEKAELYTRDEIDNLLSDKVSLTLVGDLSATGLTARNTISEAFREVKNRIDEKANRSDVYSKIEVDDIINNYNPVIDLSNYYSSEQTDALLQGKADKLTTYSKVDVYNKTETDARIAEMITQNQGNASTNVDLSDYYTKEESENKFSLKDNTYTKEEVDNKITQIATGGSVDLSNYATKQELDSKVDSSVIGDLQNTGLTGSTVTELLTDVKTKIDAIPSTGGTSQDTRIGELADLTTTEKSTIVGAINELAARPTGGGGSASVDLSNYYTKSETYNKTEVDSAIAAASLGGSTGGSVNLSNYYNKAEVEELLYNECDTQFNEAVFKYREKIDGLDDAIKNSSVGPVYRIPSLTISTNGTIHVVCDARDTGGDQGRLEIAYARSVDGGKTWSKQIIGHRYKGSGYSEANSRVMDPTILDAGNGLIFVLAGRWITGTNNWTRNADSANNWSAALLMKSTDDGRTWSQHTIGKSTCTSQEGTHITVDNLRSGCKGFLGGINPGFRHSSGKLVFQIQFTTGSGDAKSTLLTSDDNGASWRMAGGDTGGTNYECSMIELPDGRIVLHTRSEDSDAVVNGKSMKKAFVTSDFGETWSIYSPLNKKVGSKTGSGGGHRCEGGTMGATTISGAYICAAAYPQVTADSELGHTSDWARNQITLYACNIDNETVKPIQMIQYRSGLTPTSSGSGSTSGTPFGGYSSLIYKQTDDGEYFVTVFEDELGISTRNLSHLLPRLELYSGVSSSLSQSELTNVKTQVMADVNTKISAWPDNFTSFIDTHTIPENKTFNVIGSDLSKIGSLSVGGGFLNSNGNIDNTKLSLSSLLPGMLHIVCTDTSDGSIIRGNVSIDSNATILSIAMTFCQPTTSTTVDDYQPLVRFFDNATAVAPGNNKGGLEIKADGTLYVTKGNAAGILEKDRIYNIVVEYDSAGAKVFLDGVLVNTQSGTSLLSSIKSASYMCIGAQGNGGGSSSVKRVDMHIGNIAIYSRELTENEKKNVKWVNGIDNKTNTFNRFYTITEQLNTVTQSVDNKATLSDVIELLESNNWIQSHPNEKLLPKMKNLIFNLDNNTFKSNGSAPGDLMVSSSSKLRKGSVEQSNFNTDVSTSASSSNWGYKNTNVMYIGREVEDLNITIPNDKNVSCANGFSIWISATPKENFNNRSWSDLFYLSSRTTFSGGNTDHRANDNNLFRIEAGNTDSNNRATINVYGNTTLTSEKYFELDTKTNILVTVKDSKLTLYVDGEKVGSSTLGATNLIPTYIGLTKANNNTLTNKFPNVDINSISMWNVALRDDEVEAVFNSRQ